MLFRSTTYFCSFCGFAITAVSKVHLVKQSGFVDVGLIATAGQKPTRVVRLVLPRRVGHVAVDRVQQVLQDGHARFTILGHETQPDNSKNKF
jgi:hypothetical protein